MSAPSSIARSVSRDGAHDIEDDRTTRQAPSTTDVSTLQLPSFQRTRLLIDTRLPDTSNHLNIPSTTFGHLPPMILTISSTSTMPNYHLASSTNVFNESKASNAPTNAEARGALTLRLTIALVCTFVILGILLFLLPKFLKAKKRKRQRNLNSPNMSEPDFSGLPQGKHTRSDWVQFDGMEKGQQNVPTVMVNSFDGPIDLRTSRG